MKSFLKKTPLILMLLVALFFHTKSVHAWTRDIFTYATQEEAHADFIAYIETNKDDPYSYIAVAEYRPDNKEYFIKRDYGYTYKELYYRFGTYCADGDSDSDGVCDPEDNCPETSNLNQQNSDGDEYGDACDNCPHVSNADQLDSDDDSYGDLCDNCPSVYNPDQADWDGDEVGDVCDECVITLKSSTGRESLPPGGTATITATINPSASDPSDVIWTVSPEEMVDISPDSREGLSISITAKETAHGWLTITATNTGGLGLGCSKTAKLKIGCAACEKNTCDVRGGGFFEVSSIDARFNIGKTFSGISAGNIFLNAQTPDPANATPAILEAYSLGDDTQPIYDGSVLRQIVATESFVDIVVVDDYSYNIIFYSPDAIGNLVNDIYEVDPTASPLVTWTIENPDASPTVYNRLKITENKQGVANVFEYVWDETANTWSLTKGNGLQVTTKKTEIIAGNKVVTEVIKDDNDKVASKIKTTWHTYPWGEEVIEKVEDPDSVALTTTMTYYEDAGVTGSYSRLKTKTQSDGSWTRYEYDTEGRKSVEITSWLDASSGSGASSARAMYYDYIPVDLDDAQSGLDERQPRTITETILGQVVRKTYYAYKINAANERIKIEEQCVSPGAAYGDAANLRTEQTYYELATGLLEAGRIKSVAHSDSKLDNYTYEYGTYAAGSDPSQPGTFTSGTGLDVREVVTYGTVNYPSGVSYKTTQDVVIKDIVGNPVLQETYIYTGSGYVRIEWIVQKYNDAGQVTDVYRSDGTHSQTNWGCCYKESETDALGITKNYTPDDLKRVDTMEKQTVNGSVFTSYTYDAVGRKLSQIVSAGTLSLSTGAEYDIAGRLLNSTDNRGLITDYEYELNGRRTIITRPGNITEITERHIDGRTISTIGTGVVPRYYTYGVNTDGTQWTQVNIGSEFSPMWEKTTTDMLGRAIRIEKPGYTGGIETTEYEYNNNGRLERVINSGQADTLYVYDELGNQIQSGLDIDGNGSLDENTTDRITETQTLFTEISGDWWQETVQKVYATDLSSTATTVGMKQTRLTGLGTNGLVSETIATDIHGNQTTTEVLIDSSTQTQTQTINYPDSDTDAVTTAIGGLVASTQTKTGVIYTYDYDDLERRTEVTDPRTGTTKTVYNAFNQIDYIEDPALNRTIFTYDPATGRKIAETKPLDTITRYAYNDRGQVTHTWGGATYPVHYVYNDYGRMAEMHTYQTGSGWDSEEWPTLTTGTADITIWHYQESTGLLTDKEDAEENLVTYTYTAGGKLDTRTWARLKDAMPLVTTYIYDPDTGELTDIDYSDDTTDINFTYDRLGRQETISDALGTRTFTYNPTNLQFDNESIVGLYSRIITRTHATSGMIGRSTGFNTGSDYSVTHDFDTKGRLNDVTWNVDGTTQTATYTHIPDTDLLYQLTTTSGQQTTYNYESDRNLRTKIQNQFDTTLVSQYDYIYNELGNRKTSTNSGKALIEALGNKLNNASWFEGAQNTGEGIEIPTEHREYQYDNIGNRSQSTDWDSISEDYISTIYNPNPLNQYDQTARGSDSTTYTYDNDGNLETLTKNASTMLYHYNAENRLTAIEPEIPAAGDKKIEFVYDYMGRRVQKLTYAYVADDWQLEKELLFVYDGWNLIEEITLEGAVETSRYFVWGLDLSQSLQGAGGVGGLLAVVDDGVTYHVNYDGNGNVTQLVNAADGAIAAHMEYDPYGNIIYESGSYADENPFRFSTKYHDDETGLVYYGYRYYYPEIGRWINRDPLSEEGGINLYSFVSNNPITIWDYLGLAGDKTHGLIGCKRCDDCQTIIEKMEKIVESLKERRKEMMPYTSIGQPWKDYSGHAIQIFQQFAMLGKCKTYYIKHKPPCPGSGGNGLPYIEPFQIPGWKHGPSNKPFISPETKQMIINAAESTAKAVTTVIITTSTFIFIVIVGS